MDFNKRIKDQWINSIQPESLLNKVLTWGFCNPRLKL